MKIALFGINFGACANPRTAAAVARAAEAAGFESLWTGEHVVLPDPQAQPSPSPPEVPFLDPATALAFVAAHTTRVRLGTGIIILPQRNPLVLAKELASVDVLSQGRLVFGIGVGYLKAEFDALGAPFEQKGARSEDYLAAMLAIWTMAKPEHHGRFASFAGVRAEPRPVQKPHPPVVFGGHTPEAFRRAARLAQGWYGFALDVEAAAECIEGVRAACTATGRRFEELEISVTPAIRLSSGGRSVPGLVDRDTARRYADLGVHRLIVYPAAARDEAGVLGAVRDIERELIGKT
jgi:probable F420-dependent oxidoreductase